MEPEELAPEQDPAEEGRPPFLQGMARQMALIRHAYPDLGALSLDYLFVCFLNECARLGRFVYGPIVIEVRVVEAIFEREYPRRKPGDPPAPFDEPYRHFYERLSAEVTRSGRRRIDDLHWLMTFMRTTEGLPARVFGELGIRPEDVDRIISAGGQRAETTPTGLERLYSPEEIADYLGVHVQTVRAWVRSGRLPARRIFGQRSLRIRKSDLDAVLLPVRLHEEDREELRR
jgi:excisionase family DNA binding protein